MTQETKQITLNLTEEEINKLKHAVEVLKDMDGDMVLDDLWISEETTAITRDQLMSMRKETENRIDDLMAVNTLHLKVLHATK